MSASWRWKKKNRFKWHWGHQHLEFSQWTKETFLDYLWMYPSWRYKNRWNSLFQDAGVCGIMVPVWWDYFDVFTSLADHICWGDGAAMDLPGTLCRFFKNQRVQKHAPKHTHLDNWTVDTWKDKIITYITRNKHTNHMGIWEMKKHSFFLVQNWSFTKHKIMLVKDILTII